MHWKLDNLRVWKSSHRAQCTVKWMLCKQQTVDSGTEASCLPWPDPYEMGNKKHTRPDMSQIQRNGP